jgi:Domain of unknown function (DUF2019)
MSETERMQRLVEEFAASVIGQTEAIRQGDRRKGNTMAKRYVAAFQKLREIGDGGRDALTSLFTHPRADVRVMAACYLLRHSTPEALNLLQREAAVGRGLAAFGASEAIKRWEEGAWNLDPAEGDGRKPGTHPSLGQGGNGDAP